MLRDWVLKHLEKQLASVQLTDWYAQLAPSLAEQIDNNQKNWQRYAKLIHSLPSLLHCTLQASAKAVTLGSVGASTQQAEKYRVTARQLMPWRKGPFSLLGTAIDSEWQCQYKWQRLTPHVDFRNASVLDVGGGNGYYAWRAAQQAKRVIICDPSVHYWAQFSLFRQQLPDAKVAYVPCALDSLPQGKFDTVLCLGVLYHSPSPFALLRSLKNKIAADGILLLETLVTDGDEQTVFTPQARYAGMANVWAIPSVKACQRWLTRCGFTRIEVGDIVATTAEEQRATDWSNSVSLADFLDNRDTARTIEGYPAPKRAMFKIQM